MAYRNPRHRARRQPDRRRETATQHAQRRARERYRMGMDRWSLEQLRGEITAGRARVVRRQGPRTVYLVCLWGKEFRLVYEHATGLIVTFLPPKGARDAEQSRHADRG